ncbi:hypothetical protein XELAEV_18028212mg [Xenopus laevis]|uniref:Uncharacterized protein n=1 Tax=Xenopus laevis TaxID=8355 RepID=A0A974HKC3_XENLA|nr:hypothetical protein XELAEV_18028212mg [Xenopus laevis]
MLKGLLLNPYKPPPNTWASGGISQISPEFGGLSCHEECKAEDNTSLSKKTKKTTLYVPQNGPKVVVF